jgi:hypothetical protein
LICFPPKPPIFCSLVMWPSLSLWKACGRLKFMSGQESILLTKSPWRTWPICSTKCGKICLLRMGKRVSEFVACIRGILMLWSNFVIKPASMFNRLVNQHCFAFRISKCLSKDDESC